MTAKDLSDGNILSEVVNSAKESVFAQILKQPRYSGKVVLKNVSQTEWVLHLHLGTIVYAEGGVHPARRWRRNLAQYCPRLSPQWSAPADLDPVALGKFAGCWEYYLICLWLEQGEITLDRAEELIHGTIVEALFDILQTPQITPRMEPEASFATQVILNDAERAINEAQQLWWLWQNAKIAHLFPDRAPIIVQPEQLQEKTSPGMYNILTQLLDGEHSLRDLGVRMKKDVFTVTRSLWPYIHSGLIRLVEIPDLPSPVNVVPLYSPTGKLGAKRDKPLIACVDDSPLICQSMKQLLTKSGYDFVAVNDPLRAIAVLLSCQPDLIFLDLVMPNANGYEICAQLRKLTVFRKVPIVILTGNEGIIDRVRAKIVGSSDFINKPVRSETLLEVVRKHLKGAE
jgi:chemotaxis family two-component system response regulator PixG